MKNRGCVGNTRGKGGEGREPEEGRSRPARSVVVPMDFAHDVREGVGEGSRRAVAGAGGGEVGGGHLGRVD